MKPMCQYHWFLGAAVGIVLAGNAWAQDFQGNSPAGPNPQANTFFGDGAGSPIFGPPAQGPAYFTDQPLSPAATPPVAGLAQPPGFMGGPSINGGPLAMPGTAPLPGGTPLMTDGALGIPSQAMPPAGPTCPPPCASAAESYWCPPSWYIGAGAHILGRNRARDIPLGYDTSARKIALSTKSDSFDAAPGGYITLGRYLGLDTSNRNHYIEFNHWIENYWQSGERATANERGNIGTVANPVIAGSIFSYFESPFSGFTGADSILYDYDSRLLNFELNYWLRPRGRQDRMVLYPNGRWYRERNRDLLLSFMFGFRSMVLDEDFTYVGENRIVTNTGTTEGRGWFHSETENLFIGFQVGGDLMQRGRRWEWGLQAKGAPMVNFSEQTSTLYAEGNLAPRFVNANESWSADEGGLAFLAEFGPRGKYWITPTTAVSAAYTLYWLAGAALAPEQLKFAEIQPNEVENEAVLFMHGLSLGFEVQY